MKPLTIKQKIVCVFISLIEMIINSPRLIKPLICLSNLLETVLLCNGSFYSGKNSIFKGLSVAFIADGNRRWMKRKIIEEKKNGVFKTSEDSEERKVGAGSDKIAEIVKFAYFHNLKEVSFYCFAIKNFNRAKAEVDGIMNYIKKYGIVEKTVPFKFKVYGKLELLDPKVKEVFMKLEEGTKDSQGPLFNLFFGYSSSDDENNKNRFSNHVDLLVRTGGDRRLSDFLVRHVAKGTSVEFVKTLWPELSLVHLWLLLSKLILENKFLKD